MLPFRIWSVASTPVPSFHLDLEGKRPPSLPNTVHEDGTGAMEHTAGSQNDSFEQPVNTCSKK